ncbi:MAG: ribosome maturation factor RimP [Holophagaceae bacterium]
MINLTQLQSRLESQITLLGYELLALERANQNGQDTLRLYVDHLPPNNSKQKVNLDDCVRVHESLLAWMDVEFPEVREHWGLEISSPGMERPLVKPNHFLRFTGRLIRVQTTHPINGQKKFKGWIGTQTPTEFCIEEDGQIKTIPFNLIDKAKLAPFDEASTPPPKHFQGRITALPQAGTETSLGEA